MYYKESDQYEDWVSPSKESKRHSALGRNSEESSTNTIDDIINDEDTEIQSIIDVSRCVHKARRYLVLCLALSRII